MTLEREQLVADKTRFSFSTRRAGDAIGDAVHQITRLMAFGQQIDNHGRIGRCNTVAPKELHSRPKPDKQLSTLTEVIAGLFN